MKQLKYFLILSMAINLIFYSCESEDRLTVYDPEFRIEFSDGSKIIEDDIILYDSSTHLIFLQHDLSFNYAIKGFNVLVDNDIIYNGIIHSCMLSTPPPVTYYISDCFFYGNNIIELGSYGSSEDLRNDQQIMNALKYSYLLYKGLSCCIDSIAVSILDRGSSASCKITVTNNDKINYYILDPEKMGELDFNYYTGGLSFQNIETKANFSLRWSVSNPEWSNLTINDFTVLPGNSKMSFTFKSTDYYKMDKGFYNTRFRFCGLLHNTNEFDLRQDNGRIWVGSIVVSKDSIFVE